MKIEIIQSKLIQILDYLYVGGLFPFAIIQTKGGKLYSIQQSKEGFAFRFAEFHGDYFKNLSEEEEAVQLDVEKVKNFASLRRPEEVITIEYPINQKIVIKDSKGVKNRITVTKLDAKDIKKGLPFKIKNKIPYIKGGQVALDTHVTMSLASFKGINDYATAHGTDTFTFKIGEDRNLKIQIGDVHALEDDTEYPPNAQVNNLNEELKTTFTKGIKELTKTFTGDVDIHTRSNMPAWFSEVSKDHKFGVLISPQKGAN